MSAFSAFALSGDLNRSMHINTVKNYSNFGKKYVNICRVEDSVSLTIFDAEQTKTNSLGGNGR